MGEKLPRKAISWHLRSLGNRFSVVQHIVYVCHRCSIAKKSSQAKNVSNTEKMGDQWLKCKLYYNKKMWNFVFNYNKNDLHYPKAYKNLHIRQVNSFFISKIVFKLYCIRCQKRVFDQVPSSCCDILGQFSHLKQQ
jgi:hypothetical protein